MCIQSEATLEKLLIQQLVGQGYEAVDIQNEDELTLNFKVQLERHNETQFSDKEFSRILNHLNGGTIFEKSKKLRDRFELPTDNGDIKYVQFLNTDEWCKNIFQVTNQITMVGMYENRYDITLLINGLPLMQIELKRRGIEMKEAFNQICRYQRHSFKGLFRYIQLFVVSNGVNTKYFSNNRELNFKQTFYWTDIENTKYSQLTDFATHFLEKCHLAKMIAKYIVLNETDKCLMVLRPYQYYAVEKIVKRVAGKVTKNGYIWHTTGSGKTLTSFKTSQLLINDKDVDKVLFVVDRNDLDYQTIKEFNAFSKGSVDSTDNTNQLIRQMIDSKTKLIITTIQKLNNAIAPKRSYRMEEAKDKRTIFIFDECHRSQFGDTHKAINEFFNKKLFFGFTGTPIFAENNIKNKTTKDLFDTCLHKYVIKDAIDDENVLGFSVEYYSTFKGKKELQDEDGNDLDVDEIAEVEGIDTKEVFENPKRLNIITDHILNTYNRKTYNREFSSIFAVSSIDNLIKYYDLFKGKDHPLKVATIFTYGANEDLTDESGNYVVEENINPQENKDPLKNGKDKYKHTREKLDEIVLDFNKIFGTNHNLNKPGGFQAYFVDISQKVKEKKIDILLVVNMFLTGFDSKKLNTLFVDKNLKYHGLIQAYSRTNRILGEKKKFGNVVCYRNLKKRTDWVILHKGPKSDIGLFM